MISEIKARLEKAKQDNVTNFVQREHADIEYLLRRLEQYETALSDIAFGYVEGDYADVRQFAREQLTEG